MATKPTTITTPATFRATPLAEEHDEWRLDEALAETFPASDPIAVNPIRGSAISNATSNKDDACDPAPAVSPKNIECVHCHTKIPATVALNFEGADYIYQFCGPQCLYVWRMTTIV